MRNLPMRFWRLRSPRKHCLQVDTGRARGEIQSEGLRSREADV